MTHDACRCGRETGDIHPCHMAGYTCPNPAKQRFYAPKTVSLTGVMMKFEVQETWACDECWAWFTRAYRDKITVK